MNANAPTSRPDLVLTRTLDAPRELVYKVWTDPKHVAQWWGPHGFTVPLCEMDARPGGALHIRMEGFGMSPEMTGTFLELVEPERIVFTGILVDDAGVSFVEITNTVTLAERGDKTELTLTAHVTKAGPGSDGPLSGMDEGWNQSLERLSTYLASVT
jgi:uncharacterized protein YndB with AHSA1/START domain